MAIANTGGDAAEYFGVSSVTISATTSGTDRFLFATTGGSANAVTAAFNGSSLTDLYTGGYAPSSAHYKIAPAATTANLVFSNISTSDFGTVAWAAYTGVHQSSPLSTAAEASSSYISVLSVTHSTFLPSVSGSDWALYQIAYSVGGGILMTTGASLDAGAPSAGAVSAIAHSTATVSSFTTTLDDGAGVSGTYHNRYFTLYASAGGGGDTISPSGMSFTAFGSALAGRQYAYDATAFSAGTATAGNNASVTPPLPSGWAQGDTLLCFASIRNDGTGSPNVPTGYTSLWAARNMRLSAKIAGSSESAPSQTFTGGATNATTLAQMFSIRGLLPDLANIVAHTSSLQQNASAQNVATPALTVTTNRCVVLCLMWKQDDCTSQTNAGFATQLGFNTSTTGSDATQTLCYTRQDSAANISAGTSTVTGGAAAISNALVIALKSNVDQYMNIGSFGPALAHGTQSVSNGTGSLQISPSGVVTAEAFGTLSIRNSTVQATGIAATLVFGTANIRNATVFGTGIATTLQFGTATLGMNVTVTGISSAEAFGTARLDRGIATTGIAATLAFGTPQLNLNVTVTGISSAEAFGTLTASVGGGSQSVTASGIATAEAFGTANAQIATIQATGIVSGEAFGAPTLNMNIAGAGIASAEAFGTANAQKATVFATGINSLEAFGTARLDLALVPTGIASAEAFGTHQALLVQTITATGIAPTLAFGTAQLNLNVTCTGITSAEAFGAANVALGSILSAGAIATAEAFGSATLSLGGSSQSVTVNGMAATLAFGVPVLTLSINPASIAATLAFGTALMDLGIQPTGIAPTVVFGTVDLHRNIIAVAIGPTAAFGTATTLALNVLPTPVVNGQSWGDAYLYNTLQFITVTAISSGESVTMPTLIGGNAPIVTYFSTAHARRTGKGMNR